MTRISTLFSHFRRRPVAGYALALVAVAVALVIRFATNHQLPGGFPFLTFFPAVIVTAFLAGTGPGLVAAVLGGLAALYWFIPPVNSFELNAGGTLAMAFYSLIVGVDIVLIAVMNQALERLEAERRRSAELGHRAQVMFSELQHRVSNNLQIISSLLALQQAEVRDPVAVKALEAARGRVATLGRLHRALHNPADQAVDLDAYLRELCHDIIDAAGAKGVGWQVEADPVALATDKVVPLALIVAELISNSLEHAFAGRGGGSIRIRLSCAAGAACTLQVRDDGPGLPPGFDPERQTSLGLRIVRALAAQLGGRLTMASEHGTVSTIVFAP